MMFAPGGEVFILWRPLGFMIVDLRPGGLKYEVPLETSITGRGWCLSLAAKLFIHNGVEGVVVAATFLKPKRINLLFLPFSTRGTFVHLADLVPHSTAGLSDFFFSGSHLIIVETGNSDDSFIQIYDLVHGTSYLVSVDAFLRKVQIFDESYLLVAVPPGVVLGAHLQRFRSDEHPVPFPAADGQDAWVIAKIDQTNWKSSILIPRASIPSHRLSSIKHDETKGLMCPIWGLAQDHPWNTHRGGWHSKTALVTIGNIPLDQPLTKGHASVSSYTYLDGSRSLDLFPPTATNASQRSTDLQLSAPFTAAHLPNHGRMNPRGQSRRSISEPTRIVVFAYRRPFGESQLLSATASPDVRLEGIVLSRFSFDTLDGPKIEHKLVHSRNNEGNIIPLSHNEESDPQRLNILWNEPAGTIAVVTDNREDRVHRVHFYQVQV
ncbi:hypothetical protein DL93DRAFT_1922039 [Clavulina sp. PMI_390]|nr:hypothetical protein DL93DRAFT_1922039 [Clavulina sp. PMI_390]